MCIVCAIFALRNFHYIVIHHFSNNLNPNPSDMSYIIRFLLCLFQFAVGCVFLWILFWMINCAMWASGIGGEALITEYISSMSGPFGRAIIYLIGCEWFYGIGLFFVLIEINKVSDTEDFFDTGSLLTGIAICIFTIMVYDPRIVGHLPSLLATPIEFLQTSCSAYLLGGINLAEFDASGAISDPVYYTLFDIIIACTGAFWVFAKLVLDRY